MQKRAGRRNSNMRFTIFLTVISLTFWGGLRAAVSSVATDADQAWAEIASIKAELTPSVSTGKNDDEPAQRRAKFETIGRRYRDRGLEFWRRFPNDLRRYVWFMKAVQEFEYVRYWKDAQFGAKQEMLGVPSAIDRAARDAWRTQVVAMEAEMLAAIQDPVWIEATKQIPETEEGGYLGYLRKYTPEALRSRFEELVLRQQLSDASDNVKMGLGQVDRISIVRSVLAYTERLTDRPDMGMLQHVSQWWGVDLMAGYPELEDAYIRGLRASRFEEVRNFAEGRQNIADLRRSPMDFRAPTLDGNTLDLASLRGKFVFLYCWSLGCGGCIEDMPRLQELYQKYRDKGVEFVGICTTAGVPRWDDRKRVEEVVKQSGVTFPTCFLNGDADRDFRRKYAVVYSPHEMLLGPEGNLIDFSGGGLSDLSTKLARITNGSSWSIEK